MPETKDKQTRLQVGAELNPIAGKKPVGIFMAAVALVGFAIITYRLFFYVFEYDPKYYTVDYGNFNVLSYFTIQSNIFAYLYFLCAGLAILGVKKARRFGFNGTVGALVTVYVLVAGLVYNAGFPLGMTPPLTWDTPAHAMNSFMQCYYHMFMPVVTVALWCFPFTNEKLGKKTALLAGVYPLAYSIFSMVRGPLMEPTYYPYPFYNPDFIWGTFAGDKPMNVVGAYGLIAVLLVFGIGVFIAVAALVVRIHNKRIEH